MGVAASTLEIPRASILEFFLGSALCSSIGDATSYTSFLCTVFGFEMLCGWCKCRIKSTNSDVRCNTDNFSSRLRGQIGVVTVGRYSR